MPHTKTKKIKIEITEERFIPFFRLLQYRAAVRCEKAGMKHSSGRSVTAHVKREFGIKGNHQVVIDYLTDLIAKSKKK